MEKVCQQIDCHARSEYECTFIVNINGENVKTKVRFCRDHFLEQRALDYQKTDMQRRNI